MSFIHGKWSHIFAVAGAAVPLRIVFDDEKNSLVHLDIQKNSQWVKATPAEVADVENSLKHANHEAISHPAAYGLESSGSLPAWASPVQDSRPTKVRLVLDIEVDLNGTSLDTILANLRGVAQQAYSEGTLTGSSDAEIHQHSVKAFEVPELDEDVISAHLLGRIESGDLCLEDIPNRMARFGLMDAPDFINEMQERMGM